MNDKQTHIAFVIHNTAPVPYFNWFAQYAQKQTEFKFSFIFLNEDIQPVKDKMKDWNADVYWIPFDNSNTKKSLVKSFFKLHKLFRKLKPDITHSHLFYDGLITLPAAKLAGVKIRIHTKQSTGFNWYYAPKAVRFDRLNNRLATHLIAVSSECREFILQKEKADASKVNLIHHGVDINETIKTTEQEVSLVKKQYNPENKIMALMVARYIDWKGYKYYLKAIAEVIKIYPDIIFLGIGTGPQKNELENLISELKIEKNFKLTGQIHRDLIPALYQASDFYVHTALREPFGFVIAEAMLNGLPLVTTPTGAALDAVIHLESGFIVDYADVDKLKEGILYLINQTPELRQEMGKKAALKASELFDFKNMWNGYTSLYRTALNKGK